MTLPPSRRGSRRLPWPSRTVVALGIVGAMLMFATPTVAAPAQAETTVSTKQIDASQWNVASKSVKIASGDAEFPSGDIYCTRQHQKPGCLKKPLTGEVTYLGCGKTSGGGDVKIVVQNKNPVNAPRDIAVFTQIDGGYQEFFGDRDWAMVGKNVVRFSGISDGTYLVTVGWGDQALTFFGNAFTVDCGSSGGGG